MVSCWKGGAVADEGVGNVEGFEGEGEAEAGGGEEEEKEEQEG